MIHGSQFWGIKTVRNLGHEVLFLARYFDFKTTLIKRKKPLLKWFLGSLMSVPAIAGIGGRTRVERSLPRPPKSPC